MKYLKKFDEHSKYAQFIETDEFIKPNVSGCEFGDEVHYNDEEHDYSKDYLTFTALESGTFTLTIGKYVTTSKLSYIEYSVDDGETWTKTDNVDNTTITITTPTLNIGDEVLWRGSGTGTAAQNTTINRDYRSTFSSTCRCNVSGMLTIIIGIEKPTLTNLGTYAFKGMFYEMRKLVDASKLIISGMTTYMCYYMFCDCTALTSPPQLLGLSPYNSAHDNCYAYMFYNCTSLTSAPELPATNLSGNCYSYMFYGCTSLLSAPSILPAEKLATYCYSYMFYGCTGLTSPPQLPATTLEQYCYKYMFYGCYSLTTAPVLPAKILVTGCYDSMFYECGSLNYVKALFTTDISNTDGYNSYWLKNVSSTGTFIKSPLASWSKVGASGIPEGWTSSIDTTNITEYNPTETFTPDGYLTFSHQSILYVGLGKKFTFQTVYISKNGTNWHNLQETDILEFASNENCYICGNLTTTNPSNTNYTNFAVNGSFSVSGNCNALWNYSNINASIKTYCGYNLFQNCTGLTNASGLILPSLTATNYCYYQMFLNCTALTSPPQLPATTLASYCYAFMFQGCTSLTTAPILPALSLVSNCYDYMFYRCSKLNYIEANFKGSWGSGYTNYWVSGVASTGTFVKNPIAVIDEGVDGIPEGWTITDNDNLTTEFNPQYSLTPSGYVTFAHPSTFYLGLTNKNSNHTIYISKNGTNWHSLEANDCLKFTSNENCYVCGNLTRTNGTYNYTQFATNGNFSLSGNCNSIWNYSDLTATLKDYCGYSLFAKCYGLTSAANLTLPSLTASYYCYAFMFYQCKAMVAAPSLPATTLASHSYDSMFQYCYALSSPPQTIGGIDITITEYCCQYMFQGCTSLVYTPSLPSTLLSIYCYRYMFDGCTSLTNISTLPATTLNQYCYAYMFQGCTSLVTAPDLPATTLTSSSSCCYHHMFSGCTSLVNPPKIYVTTIEASSEYFGYMFNGCTSLTEAPDLLTTTITGTWYTYYHMFQNCSSLNYMKALFTTSPSSKTYFTRDWMSGVTTSTGIFVKNINTDWNGNYNINSCFPSGWTILYFDPTTEKYYLSDKTTECDDHGNVI